MTVKKSILFTDEQYEMIENYCNRNGVNFGEAVRQIVDKQMSYEINRNSINEITEIIDERLRDIFKPQIERLASISAKGAIMSATSTFLNAQALSDFVPREKQKDIKIAYEQARLKGIAYVRGRSDDEKL